MEQPVTALRPWTRLAFGPGSSTLADGASAEVEALADRVAAAGVRSARLGLPWPRVDITGYSAGTVDGARADAVYEAFVRRLDEALARLQTNLPEGRKPLRASDFRITVRGGAGTSTRRADRRDDGAGAAAARHGPGLPALVRVGDGEPGGPQRAGRAVPGRPLDVDALARHVLGLGPDAVVDQDARRDLFRLVDRATAAGGRRAWRHWARSTSRSWA
ncbi:hypothetical protein NKH77_28970 [Streptomyces sp. M19]